VWPEELMARPLGAPATRSPGKREVVNQRTRVCRGA
jgi:hypothetical protein